jgi:hypothetical protein
VEPKNEALGQRELTEREGLTNLGDGRQTLLSNMTGPRCHLERRRP